MMIVIGNLPPLLLFWRISHLCLQLCERSPFADFNLPACALSTLKISNKTTPRDQKVKNNNTYKEIPARYYLETFLKNCANNISWFVKDTHNRGEELRKFVPWRRILCVWDLWKVVDPSIHCQWCPPSPPSPFTKVEELLRRYREIWKYLLMSTQVW